MARRSTAQKFTDHNRFEHCGRAAVGSAVTLRMGDAGFAGVAGVETCGSVWCCSVCSAKINQHRAEEIGAGLAHWWSEGHDVAMLTLTMRHNKGHKLATLWDALSYAWGRVTSGKQWITEKAMHNVAGFVRVAEITQGKRGWHVHLHVLILLRRDETLFGNGVQIPELMRWKARIVQRWSSALDRKGFSCVDDAQDLKLIARGSTVMADYITKAMDYGNATAREVTGAQGKTASFGNRTPWQILDDVISTGDLTLDGGLWQEYVDASAGRRQMTFGRGTREALGMTEEERTDEDVAAEEVGTEEDDVLTIPARAWWGLSSRGDLVALALDNLEVAGPADTVDLLRSWGVAAELIRAEKRQKTPA